MGTSGIAQIGHLAVAGARTSEVHRAPKGIGPIGVADDLQERSGRDPEEGPVAVCGKGFDAQRRYRRARIVGGKGHMVEDRAVERSRDGGRGE